MLRRVGLVLVLAVALVGAAVPAQAVKPVKTYATCEALWKDFPNGIAESVFAARALQKEGYKRAKVNYRAYVANYRLPSEGSYDTGYVRCAVELPPTIPGVPRDIRVYPFDDYPTMLVAWDPPDQPITRGIIYDVYLDGVLIEEGLDKDTYVIRDLTPSRTYTVGVVARTAAGSSDMVTASGTIASQEQIDNPGRVKVIYSATGLVDVTIETPTGVSQFANVTDPTYTFWFFPGDFVYISAQNQNSSGSVACSITSNGSTISRNTSSGAYVIATCSGSARE